MQLIFRVYATAYSTSTDKDLQQKSRLVAETHENCRYFALEHNIGRASIRNFLADQSKYDKLLFLDCDTGVKDKQFLKKYTDAADKASVVCGGLIHPDAISWQESLLSRLLSVRRSWATA